MNLYQDQITLVEKVPRRCVSNVVVIHFLWNVGVKYSPSIYRTVLLITNKATINGGTEEVFFFARYCSEPERAAASGNILHFVMLIVDDFLSPPPFMTWRRPCACVGLRCCFRCVQRCIRVSHFFGAAVLVCTWEPISAGGGATSHSPTVQLVSNVHYIPWAGRVSNLVSTECSLHWIWCCTYCV